MPRNNIDLQPCPFNQGVMCDMGARLKDCARCGWSPAEERRRKMELIQKEATKNGTN